MILILKFNVRCITYRVTNLGGEDGNRTHDLLNAIQTLSQLSYNPIYAYYKCGYEFFTAFLFPG